MPLYMVATVLASFTKITLMLLLACDIAPLLKDGDRMDGMIQGADGAFKPGLVLALWKQARERVGVVKAKDKPGVKFRVRSAEELVDRLRDVANDLGLLIYPAPTLMTADGKYVAFTSTGKLHQIERGTLAEVNQAFVVQAIEDGSKLAFFGFGLGADNQDKAGGKAGTYAMKQALIQALLAGGKDNARALGVADTDDTDTPIKGGVRKPNDTLPRLQQQLMEVQTSEDYQALRPVLLALTPTMRTAISAEIRAARLRAGLDK